MSKILTPEQFKAGLLYGSFSETAMLRHDEALRARAEQAEADRDRLAAELAEEIDRRQAHAETIRRVESDRDKEREAHALTADRYTQQVKRADRLAAKVERLEAALRRFAVEPAGGTGDASDWSQCRICYVVWRTRESHNATCPLAEAPTPTFCGACAAVEDGEADNCERHLAEAPTPAREDRDDRDDCHGCAVGVCLGTAGRPHVHVEWGDLYTTCTLCHQRLQLMTIRHIRERFGVFPPGQWRRLRRCPQHGPTPAREEGQS